jgi:phosphate transport system substrate-binding protein
MWQRALLVVAALMIGSMVLAACGDGNSDTSATNTTTVAPTTAAGSASPSDATASLSAGTRASPDGTDWSPRDVKTGLTGSGASFPDPIYQSWIEAYKSVQPDVKINYQSVGSGQGKKDFAGGVTDFGASDAFMTDEELAKTPDALHIPTVLGAVTIIYNLSDLASGTTLQFSGETLANIFLGTITTWNDPAIAADNPGVDLPDTPITVVHRSDGSGTTSIFTDYLGKVSSDWESNVGSGTAVQWPVGIGAEKNPGVTAAVQQTPGAIGYVELIYALENNLPAPAIKNAAGTYVAPSIESTSAAAAGYLSNLPDDLRVSITDPQEGDNAYPIAGFTWLLVNSKMQDMNKAQALTDFIYWCLTTGEESASQLHYAPLPDPVRALAIDKLTQVTVDGQQVFEKP